MKVTAMGKVTRFKSTSLLHGTVVHHKDLLCSQAIGCSFRLTAVPTERRYDASQYGLKIYDASSATEVLFCAIVTGQCDVDEVCAIHVFGRRAPSDHTEDTIERRARTKTRCISNTVLRYAGA